MANNYPKNTPAALSPQQNNAMREQQIINARILAIDKALEVARLNGPGGSMEAVLADAKKVEAYLIGDVQALKPQSGIIQQVTMPPAGMFKAGE